MTPKRRVGGIRTPSVTRPIHHINRQIPPLAHTPMYVWHKFWGRKTWNVIAEYIKTYCPKDGVVLDPFAGSGIVAMEALKAGRKAIVCDLLPVATEITRLTLKPVDVGQLQQAFERVANRVKKRILELYETTCRNCRHIFPFTCAVWEKERSVEIRYQSCPRCGDRQERNCRLNRTDRNLLRKIDRMRIKAWYPNNLFYYPDGTPFMKKEHYESLDQLFTKRNLTALAWLMEAIEEESRSEFRDFLKIAFSSMVHLCSRMRPEDKPGRRPFSGAGWTEPSYWFAPRFLEVNVWSTFERAVIGRQGLLDAKSESNRYFSEVMFAPHIEDLLQGRGDVYIHNGDSTELMKRMTKNYGTCVDYIFTDPPYDASVQYGELAFLWVAWLRKDQGYLDQILSKEIIRNDRQRKPFEVYQSLLRNSFLLMYEVLKPNNYLTLTFHNPTFKVRNATINAGVMAGFEFDKIHHQELARPSAKSLLQPFGSARGDFYLRFHKPITSSVAVQPEEIDEVRFERIVLETTKRVLAERGEATPYTILINATDPELARNGYFSELLTGLDVQTVLEKHLNKEFVLIPMRIGGKEGKGWWFQDPASIPHLKTVPLSERVEQTVLRKLQERGRVTFTDMWKAISEEFPNSLTTDSTSISDALQVYARQVGKGEWMLKPAYNQGEMHRIHTRMIAILAKVGKAHDYDIWVGRREQGDPLSEGFPGREGKLRQFVSRTSLKGLENIRNVKDIENIDVLWLRGNQVKALFEVEATTSMTESLRRGSNIEASVPKYLMIPEEHEDQLLKKLRSPLFGDRFKQDFWNPIFLEVLDNAYQKDREKVDVTTLVSIKSTKSQGRRSKDKSQLSFLENEPDKKI